MSTLKFSIDIKAPAAKVWEALWKDSNYRQWTSAFTQGSYAESDWNEGSEISFLGPNNNGMFSIIDKKIINQEMTFRHQGEIKDGVKEKKEWAGARESYYLAGNNGNTVLNIELDDVGEGEQYFRDTFPKALDMVKQIAEK